MGNARKLADNLPLTGSTSNRNMIINSLIINTPVGGWVVSPQP